MSRALEPLKSAFSAFLYKEQSHIQQHKQAAKGKKLDNEQRLHLLKKKGQ
jgi:hypothetical protein